MNKLIIIGNLTRDPELRTTQSGISVCSFTVAVNRRTKKDEHPQADYVRVSVWRELGEICAKYLTKGKKVCVTGAVSAHGYSDNRGEIRASLELNAEEVEFLTPRGADTKAPADADAEGFTPIDDEDEIPF